MSYEIKVNPKYLGWQSGSFNPYPDKHKEDGRPFILQLKNREVLGGYLFFQYFKDDIHDWFIENNIKYSLTYSISLKNNNEDVGIYVIFEDLESMIYFKMSTNF